MRVIERVSDRERKQMCSDLGLYYKGICSHGDSLILLDRLVKAMNLLDRAAEASEGAAPDTYWFRDYYLLGGQHMILTDEGWESGESKAAYIADDPNWKAMQEVNAPTMSKPDGG